MHSLIQVRDLEKTYFNDSVSTHALRGVSFNIEKGEFVAIMGPSGSGKSTLLNILGFLDTPTKGEYLFEGKKVDEYSKDDLAEFRNTKVGFIFQNFNLLPTFSVFDNVKLPFLYSKIKEKEWDNKAKRAIESVGISHMSPLRPLSPVTPAPLSSYVTPALLPSYVTPALLPSYVTPAKAGVHRDSCLRRNDIGEEQE